ncbi:replication-relaxation family protein [Kribbella sp. NBC_01245]|uniref:replication-relaxation family protein n=1 Tax=Kribbella sp. NBC_01245 TaxID=2903578 RepID=UPI002E2C344B|nr:replication-relaxation family protein [Kribbella sp. NBC_01245]
MSATQEGPDRPIDRPIASANTTEPRRSGPTNRSLAAGNSSSTSSDLLPATHPNKRTGRRVLASLRNSVSTRDLEILKSISTHRLLTSKHIERLHFIGHGSALAATRSANRVLRRLDKLQLIVHLDRRVGGIHAGSSSYVWQLGPAGDRLLQTDAGNGARRRQREPSVRLLEHTLAVADAHVALANAAHGHALELVTVQIEPGSWRYFPGPGGARRLLRPDLAVVTAQGDYEDHWFLEVDLGSEHPPTVVRKCQLYEDYRRSGIEQDAHDVFPRVLWVVPNQLRADKLSAAIRSARLDKDLFHVVTMDQLVPIVIGGAA